MENDDLDFEPEATAKEEQPEQPRKEVYKSRKGFEYVPVLRGFTEISRFWNSLSNKVDPNKWFALGGYVRFMCSPHKFPSPASDLDIYCKDLPTFEEVKAYCDLNHLTQKHENFVSITYKDLASDHPWFPCPTIQLIKPVREGHVVTDGELKEILENFDFTAIRIGLVTPYMALADADFLHDESKKILRLKNIHCPVSSTLRCVKYGKKGYFLPPTQALSLFIDWDKRSDTYKAELIEYLAKANNGEGLTQKQVDHLEELMRRD